MEAERELRRELDALAKKRAALDAHIPTGANVDLFLCLCVCLFVVGSAASASGPIGNGKKNMLARLGGGSRDSPRGDGGAGFRNSAARTVLKENSFDDNQRGGGGKRGNNDRAAAVSKRQRLQSADERSGRAATGDDAENASERKKRAVAPYTQKDTMARSRRMFGALMGHLGKAKAQIERDSDLFKRQDSKQHEAEQREKNQSKTLEEKAKRDAAVHKLEKLIARTEVDKAEQIARLKLEHLQKTRKNANLAKFLQTVASPPIFYLPAKHTKETEDLLDASKEAHEEKLQSSAREHETRLRELEAEFTSKLEKLCEQLEEAKQEEKKKSEASSSEGVAKSDTPKEADAAPQGSVDTDEVVMADADKETDDKEQSPEGKEEQDNEKTSEVEAATVMEDGDDDNRAKQHPSDAVAATPVDTDVKESEEEASATSPIKPEEADSSSAAATEVATDEKIVEDSKPDVSKEIDDSDQVEVVAADSAEEGSAVKDEKTEVEAEEPSTEVVEAETVANEEPMGAAAFPAPAPEKQKIDVSSLKVTELREELKKRGLDTKGLKASLVARLEEAMEQEDAA